MSTLLVYFNYCINIDITLFSLLHMHMKQHDAIVLVANAMCLVVKNFFPIFPTVFFFNVDQSDWL